MTCSINADAYLQLARTPINSDSIFGVDVRYSQEYERLEQELAKSSALHAGQETDWEMVRGGCEMLLREQSKDLRVAAWLTWALYQQGDLAGLQAGLGLLLELCERFWDGLFPTKPRTRAGAVGWLLPRLEQALGEPHKLVDTAQLEALGEALKRLDICLAQHLGDQAPALLPLRRQLEALARQAQPLVTVAEPQSAPRPNPAPMPVATADKPQSDKDAQRLLRSLQEQARSLCDWWLRRNPTDARALRLSRSLLWLAIDALPPCDDQQVTTLRRIPHDRVKGFLDTLRQGRHAELLIELEASLARAPFWLDGQHLAWRCAQALGAESAMQAVESELAVLLRRLPDLESLRFHDGTPFASSETLAWINERVRPRPGPLPEPTASADSPPWEAALRHAQEVLRADGLKAAVQHLKRDQQCAHGLREQAHWQLSMARLCRQAGRPELARALLEALDQQLKDSNLERWEPELALAVARQLHGCYEQQGLREQKEALYRRLCRLDLEAALN